MTPPTDRARDPNDLVRCSKPATQCTITARYRPQTMRADASKLRHRVTHQPADAAIAVLKWMDVIEAMMRGGDCHDAPRHLRPASPAGAQGWSLAALNAMQFKIVKADYFMRPPLTPHGRGSGIRLLFGGGSDASFFAPCRSDRPRIVGDKPGEGVQYLLVQLFRFRRIGLGDRRGGAAEARGTADRGPVRRAFFFRARQHGNDRKRIAGNRPVGGQRPSVWQSRHFRQKLFWEIAAAVRFIRRFPWIGRIVQFRFRRWKPVPRRPDRTNSISRYRPGW
jgi:hypothetical protein